MLPILAQTPLPNGTRLVARIPNLEAVSRSVFIQSGMNTRTAFLAAIRNGNSRRLVLVRENQISSMPDIIELSQNADVLNNADIFLRNTSIAITYAELGANNTSSTFFTTIEDNAQMPQPRQFVTGGMTALVNQRVILSSTGTAFVMGLQPSTITLRGFTPQGNSWQEGILFPVTQQGASDVLMPMLFVPNQNASGVDAFFRQRNTTMQISTPLSYSSLLFPEMNAGRGSLSPSLLFGGVSFLYDAKATRDSLMMLVGNVSTGNSTFNEVLLYKINFDAAQRRYFVANNQSVFQMQGTDSVRSAVLAFDNRGVPTVAMATNNALIIRQRTGTGARDVWTTVYERAGLQFANNIGSPLSLTFSNVGSSSGATGDQQLQLLYQSRDSVYVFRTPSCFERTQLALAQTEQNFSDRTDRTNLLTYNDGNTCGWVLNPPSVGVAAGSFVEITFSQFDTEPPSAGKPGDVVSVYDGADTTGSLLGRFSGTFQQDFTVRTCSPQAFIRFTTDNSVARSGWLARYKLVSPPLADPPLIATATPQNFTLTNNACNNEVFRLLQGTSPLRLYLTDVRLSAQDTLRIFDGTSAVAPLLRTFPSTPPRTDSIVSTGNALFLQLKSSGNAPAPSMPALTQPPTLNRPTVSVTGTIQLIAATQPTVIVMPPVTPPPVLPPRLFAEPTAINMGTVQRNIQSLQSTLITASNLGSGNIRLQSSSPFLTISFTENSGFSETQLVSATSTRFPLFIRFSSPNSGVFAERITASIQTTSGTISTTITVSAIVPGQNWTVQPVRIDTTAYGSVRITGVPVNLSRTAQNINGKVVRATVVDDALNVFRFRGGFAESTVRGDSVLLSLEFAPPTADRFRGTQCYSATLRLTAQIATTASGQVIAEEFTIPVTGCGTDASLQLVTRLKFQLEDAKGTALNTERSSQIRVPPRSDLRLRILVDSIVNPQGLELRSFSGTIGFQRGDMFTTAARGSILLHPQLPNFSTQFSPQQSTLGTVGVRFQNLELSAGARDSLRRGITPITIAVVAVETQLSGTLGRAQVGYPGRVAGKLEWDFDTTTVPRSREIVLDDSLKVLVDPECKDANGRDIFIVKKSLLPNAGRIIAASPNPISSGVGEIKYIVQQAESIELSVVNSLGERVNTILKGIQHERGVYAVPFDTSQLPSGTYMILLQSASTGIFHTMIQVVR